MTLGTDQRRIPHLCLVRFLHHGGQAGVAQVPKEEQLIWGKPTAVSCVLESSRTVFKTASLRLGFLQEQFQKTHPSFCGLKAFGMVGRREVEFHTIIIKELGKFCP